MIEIEDIRVGNNLLRDGEIDIVNGVFCEMSNGYLLQAKNYLDYSPKEFSPVHITRGLLLQNGWEQVTNFENIKGTFTNFKISKGIHLSYCNWYDENFSEGYYYIGEDYHEILFVHKLQNYLYENYNFKWNLKIK